MGINYNLYFWTHNTKIFMMKSTVLLVFTLLISFTLKAQYPDLEISIDSVTLTPPLAATVDVPIRAGTNWNNITALNGTIVFDTNVITWNQMAFWGLSNQAGAQFTYQGGGVVTYTWTSLITVGPSLSAGGIVFALRFNVVGGLGQYSPVSFSNTPQQMYWNNGFGWSGNNFTSDNGVVILDCIGPATNFSTSITGLDVGFSNASSGAPTTFSWDFGDGNTDNIPNPTHTYASPGTYSVCLISTNGCGSDTTCKNITVTSCTNIQGTDTQTACISFNWIDGNTYVANNNTATFNIVGGAANGCDSLVMLDLTIIPNDTSVSQTNTTLTVGQAGATYQWIDCNNGDTILPGATNQSYTATVNGGYAVTVTNNGCVETSSCYSITTVGLDENQWNNAFSVYPNPTNNKFVVNLKGALLQETTVSVYNVTGKLVYNQKIAANQLSINTENWANGIYQIKIENATQSISEKMVVQH